MKRMITASLVLASFVCAPPATAAAQPTVAGRLASCPKTYTVAMATRAARSAYSGTRHVLSKDLTHLAKFLLCQRVSAAQTFVTWYYSHRRGLWQARIQAPTLDTVPESSLAACIVQRESTNNPHAVNGQYEGLAQWSPTSWSEGGGTRFAATPLGASYDEQVTILNNMLPSQAGQWTPYDGC